MDGVWGDWMMMVKLSAVMNSSKAEAIIRRNRNIEMIECI